MCVQKMAKKDALLDALEIYHLQAILEVAAAERVKSSCIFGPKNKNFGQIVIFLAFLVKIF